jgi:hypothetical protein
VVYADQATATVLDAKTALRTKIPRERPSGEEFLSWAFANDPGPVKRWAGRPGSPGKPGQVEIQGAK